MSGVISRHCLIANQIVVGSNPTLIIKISNDFFLLSWSEGKVRISRGRNADDNTQLEGVLAGVSIDVTSGLTDVWQPYTDCPLTFCSLSGGFGTVKWPGPLCAQGPHHKGSFCCHTLYDADVLHWYAPQL